LRHRQEGSEAGERGKGATQLGCWRASAEGLCAQAQPLHPVLPLSLSLSHTHTHKHTHSLPLTFSLSHTHFSFKQVPAPRNTLFLSPGPAQAHTLSQAGAQDPAPHTSWSLLLLPSLASPPSSSSYFSSLGFLPLLLPFLLSPCLFFLSPFILSCVLFADLCLASSAK